MICLSVCQVEFGWHYIVSSRWGAVCSFAFTLSMTRWSFIERARVPNWEKYLNWCAGFCAGYLDGHRIEFMQSKPGKQKVLVSVSVIKNEAVWLRFCWVDSWQFQWLTQRRSAALASTPWYRTCRSFRSYSSQKAKLTKRFLADQQIKTKTHNL